MLRLLRPSRRAAVVAVTAAGLALAAPAAALAGTSPQHAGHSYGHHRHHRHSRNLVLNQVNLSSDLPGLAGQTDSALINPWGLAETPASPVWVAEQGTDSASAYSLAPGATAATHVSAIDVTMPDSVAGPSGQVANTGSGFVLSDGNPAAFIFDTLDGHIEGWNPADGTAGAAEDVATVPGAGYTGLAIAATRSGDELFAANFTTGAVDVFNSSFQQVSLAPWQFTDPRLPAGYLAFNTQALDGHIFVTYDTLNTAPAAGAGPEGLGAGVGVVDEYTTSGRLIARIATGGPLDAPWGLAIAPRSWGRAAGSLLVGNFGDGRINIYARHGNHFSRRATGTVIDAATGQPFAEPGLWALLPGASATSGGPAALWFSAGITDQQGGPREAHGLLGVLTP